MRTIAIWMISLVLVMACMGAALAEGSLSLTGTLEASQTVAITAPFDATVLESNIKEGDVLAPGDAMFEMSTTKVYAPCAGTVAGVWAAEGDNLEDVAAVYDALLYIEPASPYIISASTARAYNTTENKYVHVGEPVYLTSTSSKSRTGTGVLTSVDGSSYTVEVLTGNLHINETCYISRDEDSSKEKGRIGSGKTARNNPVAVEAEGSLLKLYVKDGDTVEKGDLLMEVTNGSLKGKSLSGSTLSAGEAWVVLGVNVSVGDGVTEGQTLATVFPDGSLDAVVQVEEADLGSIQAGDAVTVALDGFSEKKEYAGKVQSISSVANGEANGVAYDVAVTFANDGLVRQGMSVTVTTEN